MRRSVIERLWEPDLAGLQAPLWAALTPLSILYRGALAVRAQWWQRMARESPVATISVGNLTVGGNGKTPFTLFLARLLQTHGYRVGIVSRGYAREGVARAALIADRGNLILPVEEAGDEPAMMAHSFNGPIAVARRRIDGINLLLENVPLDVVILDDAFQHRSLRRDLDLVLIGARRGFGNAWTLPAGPLREPLSALRRAGLVVTISSPWAKDSSLSTSASAALDDVELLRAETRARALLQATRDGWVESPLAIRGRGVVAVCGLADPGGFIAMLQSLGARIIEAFEYPDHHRYQAADCDAIRAAAQSADMVLTTEKDLVKLERFCSAPSTLYAVRIEVTMTPPDQTRLLEMVSRSVEARRQTDRPPSPPSITS